MELTRRDALAALAAIGIGGGALAYSTLDDSEPTDPMEPTDQTGPTEDVLETTVALSAVLYPSGVEGRAEFVRTWVTGRYEGDEDRAAAIADAVDLLDERAREEHDVAFRELSPEQGDALLSSLSMEYVEPAPEGSELERIRFHLVNELLYGLLTSPKGGQIVGIDNPPGHPGGLAAYQEGPQA